MNPPPLFSCDGLTRSFPGVQALRGVGFTLAGGRTLGLVGENGAGKSTLVNLLGGSFRPDAGRMTLAGQPHAPGSPAAAARAGVAVVHQELNLFPNLSIAENLFLTKFPRAGGLPVIARRRLRSRAAALLGEVGLKLGPDAPVSQLSPGEAQLVEIAKALGSEARLLILDEPTTSLSPRETARLFAVMGQLRARGLAIVYISHVLADVQRQCDEVVVLRDGAVVGAGPMADFPIPRLVSLMVGRSLTQLYPDRHGQPGSEPVLEARGVSRPPTVRDIRFTLHRGEVLGVAGLMGAGRTELARILFGLDPPQTGEIRLQGVPLTGGPARRIARGLAFLTEDRRAEGLCLDASIADNLMLVAERRYARAPLGLLDLARWRQAMRRIREAVRLSPQARDEEPVKNLSGGNQQKVVLGKWLLTEPAALILDEPTRGVDVGAKFELYQLIHELAGKGAGILLISSEIDELIGVCDRILVMRRGTIHAAFSRAEFNPERILAAALPAEAFP